MVMNLIVLDPTPLWLFPHLVHNLVQFCNLVPCVVSLELRGFKGALLSTHLAFSSIVRPRPRSELPSKARTSGPLRYLVYLVKILRVASCCKPACDFPGPVHPGLIMRRTNFPVISPKLLAASFGGPEVLRSC